MYTILVVDDEPLIRKGLISILKNSAFGSCTIIEARNAIKALELCEDMQVDILITDIQMGKMSGLELIRNLKNYSPKLKVIIISGYEDFSYAKKAISLGVIDYLLKPISAKDLLESVGKCIQELKENQSKNTNTLLLKQTEIASQIAALLKANRSVTPKIIIPYLSQASSKFRPFLGIRLFSENPCENLIETTLEILKEFPSLKIGKNICLYHIDSKQIGMLVSLQQKQITPRLFAYLKALCSCPEDKKNRHKIIGISEITQDLNSAIKQSGVALNYKIIFPEKNMISYDDCKNITNEFTLSEEEKICYNMMITSQNLLNINAFYDKLLIRLAHETTVTYQSVQNLYTYLKNQLLSRNQIDFITSYEDKITAFSTFCQMFAYLKKSIAEIFKDIEDSTPENRLYHIVQNLKRNIEENYAKNISLELFASQNHINVSFLSSQFHKIIGSSYQEYLNTIRMNQAKHLLEEQKDVPINIISKACGFSDQRYFSRVFKKTIGFTPNEYRETHNNCSK